MPELSPTADDELVHPKAEAEQPVAAEPEAEVEQLADEPEAEAEPEAEQRTAPAAQAVPNAVADALRQARTKEVASRAQPASRIAEPMVEQPEPAPKAALPAKQAPKAAPAKPAPAPVAVEPEAEQPAPEPEVEVKIEQPAAQSAAPKSFDELMSGLDTNGRDLVERHIAGLKAALSQERDAGKRMEKQLRTTTATAEEVAPLRSQLVQAQADAQVARARADFYERAVAEGVKRGNARLAFLAATDGGHIDADGAVNWPALRETFSDLFEPATPVAPTRPTPRASVGAGLTQPATGGARGLNQILREAAGRRS
ncbi:hypothetical protein K2Z83_13510 [Oscillochloris sp. ZM17-4]|uniref:hypothetical protein n=1 Tax=Oscillochloris sp. ZM17-4 TaxID=2866714 RepID=UPI001C738F80|nr:hypothetical protein [Oscillochloris sp. ZM17-4]MBX0328694.1 hypothetical protein [Oscillochloris sp. ZM17-4]